MSYSGVISNCHVSAIMEVDINNYSDVGGFISRLHDGTTYVLDSSFEGSLRGRWVGGLVGHTWDGGILVTSNCFIKGEIHADMGHAGGILGLGATRILDSYVSADITATGNYAGQF